MSHGVSVAIRVIALIIFVLTAPFYFGLGLIIPGIALYPMWAIWGALLVMVIVKWKDWRFVVAAPVIAAVLFIAVPLLGNQLFGWTA